ncbi:MAG: cystathionine gamma-synthase [Planctomycetes bacterium]|nr:cystathionine gamma-synthase [Planctomycetota bacterium]
MEPLRFATRAIHAGCEPDPATGAIMTPVYLTSTYVQEAPGRHKGYDYSRTTNPTRTALERNLAALEQGTHGVAYSSGMAAVDAVLKTLVRPGDRVVAGNDLYGGTRRLFVSTYEPYGVEFRFVDTTDAAQVGRALDERTRLVWVETPSNPLLRITDIEAMAGLAHSRGARMAVDNTFATPFLQRPLLLGADLAVHSTTKYLGGHSDVVGGAVVTADAGLAERLHFHQNATGAVPGPMDCFLVLRGVKTLAVRMERHSANARSVALYLAKHPRVRRVHYPGLREHPGNDLADRQMDDFGGMVSFEVDGGEAEARALVSRTRVFSLAESLGGVESLIEHPASMTHASIPAEVRRAAGLSDGLVRLSVGLEHAADLVDDLGRALEG